MAADPRIPTRGLPPERGRGRARVAAMLATAALILATPPAPVAHSLAVDRVGMPTRSGQVVIGEMVVPLRDGGPGVERLLRWAFGQYAARGLTIPSVAGVTFRARGSCTGVTGWTAGNDVTVCFTDHEACADPQCTDWRPWAKRTLVHELAHVWMARWLTRPTIDAFLERSGLPTWADASWEWQQRGVELAAETLGWATQGVPVHINARLGDVTCSELADLYVILTGRQLTSEPPCPTPT